MRFLSATKLFDGKNYLPQNSVLVIDEKNNLKEISSTESIEKSKIEFFEGIITPGFVNAHCHLELSYLKNIIPLKTGLSEFAKQIIINRNKFEASFIEQAILNANNEMAKNGIVAVGDISNNELSLKTKSKSTIFYHTFIELIGLNSINAIKILEEGKRIFENFKSSNLSVSLAPHAPYSTSLNLIKEISKFNSNIKLPTSIHNQESEEETKFFNAEKSGFNDLYSFLKVDTSFFIAPKTSSLKNYIGSLGNNNSILVHNTFTKKEDIDLTSNKAIYWCFCPSSNLYIEKRLPNFDLFNQQKNKICIGTDSLASNSSLDLIKEINIILKTTSLFSVEELLTAITFTGAKALNCDSDYGQFIIKKNSGLNLISTSDFNIQFIKKII